MKMDEFQIQRLLDQARAFTNEGKHLHAEQIYRRLIRGEPGFVPAYTELAALYAENGNIPAGIKVLTSARERFPDETDIIFLLGTLHLRSDQLDRALAHYQSLAGRKLPQVHFNLGVVYFRKHNLRKAEEQFRVTLKLDPRFPKIHESLAELLIRRKAYTEAVGHLRRGIAIDPYSWVSHHMLGLAFHALGDLKNAHNEFVAAIDMDPKEVHSWQKCGEVLLEMKQYEEAEKYLQKALELDPQFAEALANFGQLCLLRGDTARSTEYFDKALIVDPDNPRARFGKLQSRISKKT